MKAIRRICKGDSVPCLQIAVDRIRSPPEEAQAENELWSEIMKHMGSNTICNNGQLDSDRGRRTQCISST